MLGSVQPYGPILSKRRIFTECASARAIRIAKGTADMLPISLHEHLMRQPRSRGNNEIDPC